MQRIQNKDGSSLRLFRDLMTSKKANCARLNQRAALDLTRGYILNRISFTRARSDGL